ncbi:MAG: hypothetical protein ACQEWV_21770 [Bacillota bacterium]
MEFQAQLSYHLKKDGRGINDSDCKYDDNLDGHYEFLKKTLKKRLQNKNSNL